MIIPDPEVMERYEASPLPKQATVFGGIAAEVAYSQGERWLGALLDYIEGNRQYLKTYLRENIPQIVDVENEGLYLVWLDCRELGLDAEGLERFMLDKAGLWVNQGYTFGSGGEGFVRMNLGCPRSILEKGLARLHKAVNDLRRAM